MLDFNEFQKMVTLASNSEATKKELRKALDKIQSAIRNLDVAVGDMNAMLADDYVPTTKEKKEYTGKPRGRKKSADGTGTLDLNNVPASEDIDSADDVDQKILGTLDAIQDIKKLDADAAKAGKGKGKNKTT